MADGDRLLVLLGRVQRRMAAQTALQGALAGSLIGLLALDLGLLVLRSSGAPASLATPWVAAVFSGAALGVVVSLLRRPVSQAAAARRVDAAAGSKAKDDLVFLAFFLRDHPGSPFAQAAVAQGLQRMTQARLSQVAPWRRPRGLAALTGLAAVTAGLALWPWPSSAGSRISPADRSSGAPAVSSLAAVRAELERLQRSAGRLGDPELMALAAEADRLLAQWTDGGPRQQEQRERLARAAQEARAAAEGSAALATALARVGEILAAVPQARSWRRPCRSWKRALPNEKRGRRPRRWDSRASKKERRWPRRWPERRRRCGRCRRSRRSSNRSGKASRRPNGGAGCPAWRIASPPPVRRVNANRPPRPETRPIGTCAGWNAISRILPTPAGVIPRPARVRWDRLPIPWARRWPARGRLQNATSWPGRWKRSCPGRVRHRTGRDVGWPIHARPVRAEGRGPRPVRPRADRETTGWAARTRAETRRPRPAPEPRRRSRLRPVPVERWVPEKAWARASPAAPARARPPAPEDGGEKHEVHLPSGPGPSRAEVIEGSGRGGFDKPSYRRVYREYEAAVEESLDVSAVPPGRRRLVRRYFDLIRPR